MGELTLTGGARIGMGKATLPFATLKVSENKLELDASIVGSLVFQPDDIVSIEAVTGSLLSGQGVRIRHKVPHYNSNVIFWTSKKPSEVINEIKQTGFLENTHGTVDGNTEKEAIILRQQAGGFPVKKNVAIGALILWNALFLFDFYSFYQGGQYDGFPLGQGVMLACSLLILVSILTLTSKSFSKLILKEGMSVKNISKFLYLLILISCMFLLSVVMFRYFQ